MRSRMFSTDSGSGSGLTPSYERPATRPDHVPGSLEVLLEEAVPVFSFGLGNPSVDLVARFHARGTIVIAIGRYG